MLDTKAVEQKEQEPKILLYRGISKKYEGEIGHWWSTNPYYAFKYAEGGKGEMYFVKILESDLKKDASDVSLESNYENYFFKKDPSNARKVTQKELDTLESNTTFTKAGPGGLMMKTPENAVEIGKTIFDKDN
ncbi:MAG: hypothetical protein Q8R40_00245 [bacterium]|nr:hypothetical protein [bacterium]